MNRMNEIIFIIFLVFAVITSFAMVKYANTPVSELPSWVFWLTR